MTIQKIPFTSFEEITHQYIEKDKPVVIQGLFKNSGPFNWTPSLLKQRCGETLIDIRYSETGNFSIQSEIRSMTLSDYIDNKIGDHRYYVQQAPVAEVFPDLVRDIPIQNLLEQDYAHSANIWVSAKNSTTSLHFDRSNNFFLQCYGEKKFLLFDSKQTDYLYPHETGDDRHMSQVDIYNPDLELFPLFEKAEPVEVIVHPGEVLFMPTGMWHQVTGLSESISLNIWFNSFDFQAVSPAYTSSFFEEYAELFATTSSLTPYRYSDALSFCNQFSTVELHFESCVCHIALLEYMVNELAAPNQFTEGNLDRSIDLCKQSLRSKMDPQTFDEIVEIFKFGKELLGGGRLNYTDDQAVSFCRVIREVILKVKTFQ